MFSMCHLQLSSDIHIYSVYMYMYHYFTLNIIIPDMYSIYQLLTVRHVKTTVGIETMIQQYYKCSLQY